MSSLRNEALKCFKSLHKICKIVFNGDENTLQAARLQINTEFKKNSGIDNKVEIAKKIQLAKDVEIEIRTNVIQAKEREPGVYQLRVTKDTKKLDNVMYNDLISPPKPRQKKCK